MNRLFKAVLLSVLAVFLSSSVAMAYYPDHDVDSPEDIEDIEVVVAPLIKTRWNFNGFILGNAEYVGYGLAYYTERPPAKSRWVLLSD